MTENDRMRMTWARDVEVFLEEYGIAQMMESVPRLIEAVKRDQRDFSLNMIRAMRDLPTIEEMGLNAGAGGSAVKTAMEEQP